MTVNSYTILSFTGLVSLYSLSLFTSYVLNISSDKFYAPFHFLGGMLVGLFFFSLTRNAALSLALTLTVGLLWEIYEQIIWKVFIKKKKYRPGRQDTINDLVLDLLGSLLAISLLISSS